MVKHKLLGDIPALFALSPFFLMGISKGIGRRTSGARPQAEPWRGRYAPRAVEIKNNILNILNTFTLIYLKMVLVKRCSAFLLNDMNECKFE